MKIVFALLVLTVISFGNAKMYTQCEFVLELWNKHNVASEDLYKHLCVTHSRTMLNTRFQTNSKDVWYGIYSLCEPYWCNKAQKGGGCNLHCSNLINDDISDDVACAKLVMSNEGLKAWGKNVQSCSNQYQKKVESCME
jgi:C-type lysozyme/alpha-lactalbumin family